MLSAGPVFTGNHRLGVFEDSVRGDSNLTQILRRDGLNILQHIDQSKITCGYIHSISLQTTTSELHPT